MNSYMNMKAANCSQKLTDIVVADSQDKHYNFQLQSLMISMAWLDQTHLLLILFRSVQGVQFFVV